jgi:hypothetical protein
MTARRSDRVGGDHALTRRSEEDCCQRHRSTHRGEPGDGDGRGVGAEPPELRTPALGEVGGQAGALGAETVEGSRDEREGRPDQEGGRDVAAEAAGGG